MGCTITSDVTLWPATAILVANRDALAAADPTTRGWLEEVAAGTAARSAVGLLDDESSLVGPLCEMHCGRTPSPGRCSSSLRRCGPGVAA